MKFNHLNILYALSSALPLTSFTPPTFDLANLQSLPQEEYEYHVLNAMEDEGDVPPSDGDYINLEEMAQDFVLETRKIEIKCCPGAFNPTITRWKGSLLLGFRIRNLATGSTNQIGLSWMDEKFNLIGPPKLLHLPIKHPLGLSKLQDPRLITISDRLYITYTDMIADALSRDIRRMYIAEIYYDGEYFYTGDPECLTAFEGEQPQRWEKNWTPFDYNNNLMLIYTPIPHRILRPISGTGTCETIASSWASVQWAWGQLRGGTPALKVGDEYLSFFHSSKNMRTTHSAGKNITHYFMGAYTFSSEPPFKITRISSNPIVGKKFYNGPTYKTWKPLRVVFPCGFIPDDKYLWVTYGRQDHEMWIAKLDKKGLFESLLPVTSIIEAK
jgi:predicted GH43/DUF377 family glycosyl hydrolase